MVVNLMVMKQIVGTVTYDTINGTTTVISQLFNGGKFNGEEANLVDANITNLSTVEIIINGTYTNMVATYSASYLMVESLMVIEEI